MIKEFKEFLIKGNAVDIAVGFIFGAAFAGVVKSIIDNIIMPPIGLLLGRVDFSNLFIALDGSKYANLQELEKAGVPAIKYGLAITDVINFVILGFVVFLMVKGITKLQSSRDEENKAKDEKDVDNAKKENEKVVKLLAEIRDLMKK